MHPPARRRVALRVLATLALLLLCLSTATPADAARRSLRYGFIEDRIESFRFELTRTTTTAMDHLPAEADDYDIGSLTSRIATVETRLEGRVERLLARVFRDFSSGLVTRLVDLDGTIARAGGEPAPLDTDVLEGKSVSFRVLPSGELLDSSGWAHLAGAGRGGDLVSELLLQTVMRLPRDVPRVGRPVPSSYRVRVPVDAFVTRDQNWIVAFEKAEAPDGCRGCTAISYRGEITETGKDKHPARPMKITGKGTVSGTMVLSRGARALLQHDFAFDWERTVESTRSNGTLRGRVKQTERVVGSLRAEDGK